MKASEKYTAKHSGLGVIELYMEREARQKVRRAYANHVGMLNTELRAWEITIQSIIAGSPTLTGEGELEKSMDSCQKRLEYILKHEHLGVYNKLFVRYLYESILVLQSDDEDDTPYQLYDSFEDFGQNHEMWPRRVPQGYKPDIHEQ